MIYSNSFMDFWAGGLGQLGNRPESGTVEVYGDGKVKAPMTAMSDIARFTVAILDDPEMKNREVRITANVTTQENLIATWERIHHKTIERKWVSRQDLTRIIQNAAKPEDAGKRVVAQLHRSVWIDGDAMKLRAETVEATRQYPDLPIKTLQVFFSKITADVAK